MLRTKVVGTDRKIVTLKKLLKPQHVENGNRLGLSLLLGDEAAVKERPKVSLSEGLSSLAGILNLPLLREWDVFLVRALDPQEKDMKWDSLHKDAQDITSIPVGSCGIAVVWYDGSVVFVFGVDANAFPKRCNSKN